MMQLVEAVKHVHNVGYVHRDLKVRQLLCDGIKQRTIHKDLLDVAREHSLR